jgi:Hypothetical glycosyl hydrolase family 15
MPVMDDITVTGTSLTRRAALGGLAAGAAGAVLLDRGGQPRPRPAPAELLSATTGVKNRPFWLHYDSSPIGHATIRTEAARRGHVVFNAWEGHYIPAFRAAGAGNPHLKLCVYKCFSSTRSSDPGPNGQTSGALLYSWASAHHPEWFLTRNGRRIQWSGYPGTYAMDVGNHAYQQACLKAIVTDVTRAGWDGIFLDNILYSLSQYSIAPCDQYRNDVEFRAAYRSALSVIARGITAAGLLHMGNMAGIRVVPGLWDTYIRAGLRGGFDEWFASFGDGQELPDYGSRPQGLQAQVEEIRSLKYGREPYLPGGFQSHSLTDTRSFRYSFAAWLLGVSSAAFFSEAPPGGYGPPPPWRAEYDWDFGWFTGRYKTLQASVYQRIFTRGMTLVNANASGRNVTVKLANPHGTVYVDQDGVNRASVTLPPKTGMALRRVR